MATVPDALRAYFNPLALLDPEQPLVVNDAEMLAEGLVVSDNAHDAHWTESARNFIKGLVLHLVTTEQEPTLFTLRRFLTCGDTQGYEDAGLDWADNGNDPDVFREQYPSAFHYLLKRMKDNKHEKLSPIILGAAETLSACGDEERGSILSTARRHTAFLDTIVPSFIKTLGGKDDAETTQTPWRTFSPRIFKASEKGASLFLCLPAERMGTHGRWLRVMIGLLLEWAYRDSSRPACKAPFLFLLEEFFSLGHMPVIEKAAGYAAGFGVKLWAILQDITQLAALYPQSWQTFLANAGAVQVFGVSDGATTSYVSQALGEVETIQNVENRSGNYQSGQSSPSLHQKASGVVDGRNRISVFRLFFTSLPDKSASESHSVSHASSEQIQIVPLLRPDEITQQFARETGAALLLVKGRLPIWYLRVEYYNSPWFRGRYVGNAEAIAEPPSAFGENPPGSLKTTAEQFLKFVGQKLPQASPARA